jgi:DNA-binding beta-propeller fold protein YncE
LNSITFVSGSTVSVSFVSGPNCVATEIGYSEDNVNWVNNTGSCTSPRLIELSESTGTYHIRIKKICNGTSSSYVYDDFTFCSDSIRNTLSATNSYTGVGRQGMVYSSSNNKAYVLDSFTNSVKSFVPNSTTLTTEFTWPSTSYLLGYNSTNNKLYSWTGFPVSMNIRNLNTNTSSATSISGLTGQGIGKIEYNSVLNKIYAFSQSVNFTTAQISVIDGSSDVFTNQITGITLSNVHATTYNPNNNKLYFAQGGRIYSCSGNNISLDVTTLPVTGGILIALDGTNDIIYLVDTTTVYKINANTNTTISSVSITGGSWNFTSLRSMIFNPDNGKLYVSRYSTYSDGFLGVLNPTTGAFTGIIGEGTSQPLYVPTNTIYGINDTALYEICGSQST